MRQLFQDQLPLSGPVVDHRHAREMESIDRILRKNPRIVLLVLQDLAAGIRSDDGREGMSAEQVLRAVIVKQVNTFSYEPLLAPAQHQEDHRGDLGGDQP